MRCSSFSTLLSAPGDTASADSACASNNRRFTGRAPRCGSVCVGNSAHKFQTSGGTFGFGKELLPNPKVPPEVWNLWAELPTQTLPQRGARPVKRLLLLAQALSADAVSPGALSKVEKELHLILDAYAT